MSITTTETTLERGQTGQTLHVHITGTTSTSTSDWTIAVGANFGFITAGNFTDPANPVLTVAAPGVTGTATLTLTPAGFTTNLTVQDTISPDAPTSVSAGAPTSYAVPLSFILPSVFGTGEVVTATLRKNSTVVATGVSSSPYTFTGVVDGDVLKVRSRDAAGNESADVSVTFRRAAGGPSIGSSLIRGAI